MMHSSTVNSFNESCIIYHADNKPWGIRLTEGFAMQLIVNGTLMVDTFFFISGFLMAYPYLKQNRKSVTEDKTFSYKTRVVDFFGTILKRFIRFIISI